MLPHLRWRRGARHETAPPHAPHAATGPVVATEVAIGSGVLAAWIALIYIGLLWFKRMAREGGRP